MIRYLQEQEKKASRGLYESCFPEDTKEFVDYYYKYKIRDNRMIVMEEQQELQVMIHLNPYSLKVCKEPVEADYVVAVATQERVRKQGRMAKVMERALQDMEKARRPFTFLIPANSRVYRSCGFVFVKSPDLTIFESLLPGRSGQLRAAQLNPYKVKAAEEKDLERICGFANQQLEGTYDVFVHRDKDYYRRLREELKSQQGQVILVEYEQTLVGIFTYGQEEERIVIQEILFQEQEEAAFGLAIEELFPQKEVEIAAMDFMFRILDLKVLSLLLKSQEPFCLKVRVTDAWIEANNGCFEIRAEEEGSRITAISPMEVEKTMDISELTEYLLGHLRIFIREWV